MATALLINKEDVPKRTFLNGNVDIDQWIQYVELAQEIHIQNVLGTDLLAQCKSLITAGTLGDAGNEAYETLVETWTKPALVWWTMVEYLPFANYQLSNKGIYKHTSENADGVDKSEVDALTEKARDTAQYYTERLVRYLCNNSESFTEYTSNSDEDISPDKDVNFSGWYL
jgi:hypothetical protein